MVVLASCHELVVLSYVQANKQKKPAQPWRMSTSQLKKRKKKEKKGRRKEEECG